jgi:DNA-binding transcriptional ArsR family regulator
VVIYSLVSSYQTYMRPAKITQAALRAPLNWILATEGNVRILRALFGTEEPLSKTDLADRADLSLPGVSNALGKLQNTGIVESIGTGSRQSVQIRAEHPLAASLRHLFASEALRNEALVDELRQLLLALPAKVQAAWMEAAGGRGPEPSAPVRMNLLVNSRDVAAVNTALQEHAGALQRRYDITLLVRTMTRADLETAGAGENRALADAVPILGPHPASYLATGAPRTPAGTLRGHTSHAAVDRKALVMARWIAERLDRDPTLPKRARSWLVHRMHQASKREAHELTEWLHLLEAASIPRIQYILLDPGEQSTRLRQSNPFVPVLDEDEKRQLQEATANEAR